VGLGQALSLFRLPVLSITRRGGSDEKGRRCLRTHPRGRLYRVLGGRNAVVGEELLVDVAYNRRGHV
jgi:hypothetical protein